MCDHVPQYRLANSMDLSCSCGLVKISQRDLEQFTTRRSLNNFLEKTITEAVVKENPLDALLKKPTKLAAAAEESETTIGKITRHYVGNVPSTPVLTVCPICGDPKCSINQGWIYENRINS